GACAAITKTVNLTFGSFPAGGFTVAKACGSLTITNTGAASPAVQTYTIIGPGAPPSYSTTAPTSTVLVNTSTTYTIYQTVTLGGCPTTTSLVVTTLAGPNPAFTAASSFTQCFNGNQFTFTAFTAAGTHTYNFNPTANAPANSTTNPYGPVVFTAPGTYTVIHTISSGTCLAATSSVVVVNQTPTITVATGTTPGCAGGTATLVGGGGPGGLTWTGPSSYTAIGGGTTTISNFQPTNTGIYTLTANNNGCTTTGTVNMGLPVAPTATFTNTGPYCQGATILLNSSLSTTVGLSTTQFSSPWCCWSACCAGFTAAVTPTATTSSSGIYFFTASYANGCSYQFTTTVTVNSCFLPIELTSFDASCVNNAIDLNWQTATEINNESFSILRSEDDVNYEMIGLLPGSGNSNNVKNYKFTDNRVIAGRTYYYRLRQTDFSKEETDAGKTVYAICSKKNYILDVFPNPASTEVCLVSENDLNNVTIEMINALGEKIKVINNVNLTKNQKFTIDIRDVINGAYHIVVSGNETLIQKKVVTYK
ncbi:MAG TPA: T9SS type A sorting domain-containing protein, partial [Bacteroidia bacterium]|nr:T9SS type A sorting domain-containing protein [Bacteroidia bacterium]